MKQYKSLFTKKMFIPGHHKYAVRYILGCKCKHRYKPSLLSNISAPKNKRIILERQ